MYVLITLALMLSLLFIALLGLLNIERDLLRPPLRPVRNDGEEEDHFPASDTKLSASRLDIGSIIN
jgi:hypothetical protein